jgi:LmbE family N-acetylglucosaminyl deacetylase
MKRTILIFLLFTILIQGWSQHSLSSAEIYQGIKKLNVLGSVLYVAAHPDDENTRLLAYFSKERLYRTGYLSITRGDGGQNLIGDEQGIDLGLIRTLELLAARRIDGAEQFFTRAFDFGYSKEPGETLEKWNREKILSDVVWVIRKFQPDVIITRFPTTGEGGHGHHTASAILANEAFQAAADPKRFASQLKFVQPWQAKRVVWNSFNFSSNQAPEGALSMDVGAYNPIIGKSYGEIASESRSQHKSQGFGVARTRGVAMEYFRTTGGTAPQQDLFEDVVTDWNRIKGGAEIQKMINAVLSQYDFLSPNRSVPQLVKIHASLRKMAPGYWRDQKLMETVLLIEQASGLFADAFTSQPSVARGDTARIQFSLNNRLGSKMVLRQVKMQGVDSSFTKDLKANTNENFSRTINIPSQYPLTQPYWLKEPMDAGSFNVIDQQLVGMPDVEPSFKVEFHLNIEGEDIVIEKPLRYKYTDPVRGELYQPFVVMPPVTVETSRQAQVLLPRQQWRESLDYITHRRIDSLVILDADGRPVKMIDLAKGARGNHSAGFNIMLPPGPPPSQLSFTRKYFLPGGEKVQSLTSIDYDHIPSIRYFSDATQQFLLLDLKTQGKKIGYITGAGDKVPEALTQMGYEVVLLGDKELSKNHLEQFDAIISGVRAYNTNEWLNNHYDKLMDYVRNGGNLIVQYNTSNQIGPVKAKIGPYPFNISRNRVSVETVPVEITDPAHPVFNFPNKIGKSDFEGWVQERSIYHATAMDPAFKPLIRMNDPGEKPDEGSLVVAPYGKGYFTYTGLVFFRQLPAGVPGAYKLMANLIALNASVKK